MPPTMDSLCYFNTVTPAIKFRESLNSRALFQGDFTRLRKPFFASSIFLSVIFLPLHLYMIIMFPRHIHCTVRI